MLVKENRVGRQEVRATLHARAGTFEVSVITATTFVSRFRGLMLKPPLEPDHALLVTGCFSVHTAFMRYALDLLYLDEAGNVVKCVSGLRPWRCSVGIALRHGAKAAHVLELPAGSIARYDASPGSRLLHPLWDDRQTRCAGFVNEQKVLSRQRGASMIEFAVVGPIVTLIGLAILQYSMLFFAKNQINHAAFLAARAGSVANASLSKAQDAYVRGMIPLYGGGRNAAELAEAYVRAKADILVNAQVKILNPTRESFDDWSDPALKDRVGKGRRVIPNANLTTKDPNEIKSTSGQSIQDANLIKLRITQGYLPKVPVIAQVYTKYLKWLDTGTDDFQTRLINEGRIPVVTHVTLQMQSDAIEPEDPVSSPGMGNNGAPVDPGDPPVVETPGPDAGPSDPGGGGRGGGSQCAGNNCPVCQGQTPTSLDLSSDVLFPFDRSSVNDLLPEGRAQLDRLIESAKGEHITSARVVGHTDQIGSDSYNQALSLRRASAVRDYLVAHGFPTDQIAIEGKGSSEPVVERSSCSGKNGALLQECLKQNRRVSISWN